MFLSNMDLTVNRRKNLNFSYIVRAVCLKFINSGVCASVKFNFQNIIFHILFEFYLSCLINLSVKKYMYNKYIYIYIKSRKIWFMFKMFIDEGKEKWNFNIKIIYISIFATFYDRENRHHLD